MRRLLFVLIGIFYSISFFASHGQGADIQYNCLGGDQYEITATFYRDCNGIPAPATLTVNMNSSCGNSNATLTLLSSQEITPACPTAATTCNGGSYPGVEQYIYTGTVTLTPCADWVLSYSTCCRNGVISTGPSSTDDIYVEALLDNLNYPCNSSPQFTTPPVPYICVNQPFCFNHGATDIDGDSLVYSMIDPKTGANTTVNYDAPYSADQPLASNPPVSIDSQTGLVCLTPTQEEVSVMAILVEEYRNGVLIGSVIRDIQVQVIDCGANDVPQVSGIDGSATDFNVSTCPNSDVCFDVFGSDANAGDEVTMIADVSALPGATFNVDNTDPNNPIGHFCWNNIPAGGPYNFSVIVNDDGCPFNASYTASYTIEIGELPVDLGPDISSCGGGTTTLTPAITGGTPNFNYTWSPGGATSPTLDVSNGTYIVDVTDSQGCSGSDTIVVGVYPSPVAAFTAPNVCLNPTTDFTDNSTITVGTVDDWSWDFGDGVGTSTDQNPSYTYPNSGTYSVTLIATSDNNCSDTIQQNVEVFDNPVAAFTSDIVCENQLSQLTDNSTIGSIGIQSWSWDFDNDTNEDDNAQDPQNNFGTGGTYLVTLTITDSNNCTSSVTENVVVSPNPTASFTFSNECFGAATDFTDLSNGNGGTIDTWNWDFQDNGTVDNTTQNPSSGYASAGTFDAELLVITTDGCRDSVVVSVDVDPIPVANFSGTQECLGDLTTFIDSSTVSTGAVSQWSWDFGDGAGTSLDQNPTYTYTASGQFNVTLTATSDSGCINTVVIPVDVNVNPVVDFSPDTVCASNNSNFVDMTVIGDIAVESWEWDFDNDAVGDDNSQNPTYVFPGAGVYPVSLTVVDSFGCTHSATKNVYVSEKPIALFTYNQVCFGDLTNFTDLSVANGGTTPIDTWEWDYDNDGGIDDVTQNPSFIFPLDGDTPVELIVTSELGCKDSVLVNVNIDPIPVADFSGTDQCFGFTTTFTDQSTITSGAVDQWAWDFGDGLGTSILQNPTYDYPNSGAYNVSLDIVSDSGCVHSETISVQVYVNPVVDFSPDTVCASNNSNFIDMTNIGDVSIETWSWDFDNDAAEDDNLQNPTYVFPGAGVYPVSLTVVDSFGCTHSTTNSVYVSEKPIADFTFSDQCFGENTQLTNLSQDNGGMTPIDSWYWDYNNDEVADNFTQSPSNLFVPAGNHEVELMVESELGCRDSITISVDVDALPIASFVGISVCQGFNNVFTDNSTVSIGNVNQWEWDFGDGSPINNDQNPTYNYAADGSYNVTLTVYSDSGCTNNVTIPVNVYPLPTANFDTNDVCLNVASQFSDQSVGNGGVVNQWNWDFDNNGIVDNSDQSPSNYFPSEGVYNVELHVTTTDGCVDSLVKSVTIHPMPVADFSFNNSCFMDTVNFVDNSNVVTGTIDQWNWTFGNGQTSVDQNPSQAYGSEGIYSVQLIVGTDFGCADTVSQSNIEVYPLPDVDFGPTAVCLTELTQFEDYSTVSNANTSNTIVGWDWDFADGVGGSNDQNPIYAYITDGSYPAVLTVTTNNNCVDSATKLVTVHPLPVVDFTADTTNGCDPLAVNFIDQTTLNSGNIQTWEWDYNGDGATDAGGPNPNFIFENGSNSSVEVYDISLIVTSQFGCKDTVSKPNFIEVYPIPLASFSFSPNETTIVDTEIEFTDQSIIGANWSWDLGDGTTTTVQHPIHNYADTGSYLVWLYMENEYQCKDTTFKYVDIDPIYAVFIPNTFTPDGDFMNDIFNVEGYGLKELHMRIFDRWGVKMYDEVGLEQGWDGTYKGAYVPTDVYVYRIRVKDVFDEWHEYTGRVTVLR